MTACITTSEIPQVIALLRAQLVEAGLGAWEIEPWLTKATARLTRDLHDGTCAYFVAYLNDEPIAMAGALLHDDHPFFSLKTNRYGCIVDEYVLPAHRGRDLEKHLRAQILAWIAQNAATAITTTPPGCARLAVNTIAWKL